MARVNLEVSEEKKARWDRQAEEEWNGNLSAMVRHGVEREIANEHGGVPAAKTVDVSGVESRLDDIVDMLERLDRRLDLLEADDDIERIAGKLSEWLPIGRPGEGPWEDQLAEIRTGNVPDSIPTDDIAVAELAWQGTPGGLAQVSGYPQSLVEEALEQLKREIHVIHSVNHGGTMRYYKGAER